jgi:hypothetical protein
LTHGFTESMARYLTGRGAQAGVFRTPYEGEAVEERGE